MDKIVIHGGARLQGELQVLGAKNAALPLQCAALLGDGPTTFRHVPRLSDVQTMNQLLVGLGCAVEGDRTLMIDPTGVQDGPKEAPYELVKTMRASVTVMGPLLGRHGFARVSLPGGCAIGARPIDQHLRGFEALGAKIRMSHGYVEVKAKRLKGARINFDMATVGGTQNVMMAASMAKGTTVLENAAREPEVQELAIVLGKMGAKIAGAGSSTIEIEGVDNLQGIDHAILPDRIEAGTFAIAAAITGGDLLLLDAPSAHMHAVIAKLEEAGAECRVEPGGLRVIGPDELAPIDLVTRPHPGFPTDMQAQMMVLATLARGQSVITETIFENRFMHVPELCRLGADIHVNGNVAVIRGKARYTGSIVMATDLRASACLVLAGLVAEGKTEIRRVYHLDRGYETIEKRLRKVGAKIRRYHGAPS
ncbi:UDP-N-acetylglucosamine 1-carboxyvinyltransferase [Nannocystis pusilla]|uniref:UDP-N-acetylglucosamine 1-carboxyvinyltransferase n=1 Tax=Nannocystis pusilla TaxID=889268 RepID=A0A9X3EVJ2_9BACT|nr:UDP-N-acetylglucosamine 1-carboxyvinyltransferase [Nannocystis pusilla]MCY1010355.1 UDP-N-acetylglucosamine 1-carboxyvinyltransferase [Nannocystis pusilla]